MLLYFKVIYFTLQVAVLAGLWQGLGFHLGYWDTGILGYWDTGILGYWDTGILGYWDIGILGY